MDSGTPRPEDGAVARSDPAPNSRGARRFSGLFVLAGIVVLGVLSGAGYYHYQRPKVAAEMERLRAEAPDTPRGRLELWHRHGAAQIHHRLSNFGRFAPDKPWLVTHAIAAQDGGAPELWGVDCEALPRELSRLEGLTVVVELPAPRPLARAELSAEQRSHVPVFAPGAAPPDARALLVDLALYLLEGMPRALERDIEGARLVVRVAEPG